MPAAAKKHRAKDKIIKSRRTLVGILDGLRSQGKTIVLTNGCFDILHVGHIRSLEDARSRGDFLVVAVNADETVTKLKGKGLPVNPVEERMEILAGLSSVDYVCSFPEETADALIKALKPGLYAKGTDYTERSVPEAATVKEVGGKVVIVGDKKNHSSSQVVEKIRNRKFD